VNQALIRALIETGLVQFGRFHHTAEMQPFRISLEMLPSYPDVLRMIVAEARLLLAGIRTNRLVCTVDSLPLGMGLSLEIDIPLVYSRGSNDAPVYDLVGAYDIGHPAVLITNVLADFAAIGRLITKANQVGLEINSVLAIINIGTGTALPDTQVVELLSLTNVLSELSRSGDLSAWQARAIRGWIDKQLEL
jgi:hypothetical protein